VGLYFNQLVIKLSLILVLNQFKGYIQKKNFSLVIKVFLGYSMEVRKKTMERLIVMIANFQQRKEKLRIFISEEAKIVITHHKL